MWHSQLGLRTAQLFASNKTILVLMSIIVFLSITSITNSKENFRVETSREAIRAQINLPSPANEATEDSLISKANFEPVKILISAFPRSGSSLVGTVMSANPNTAYFFEPFHGRLFRYENGSSVDLHFAEVDQKFLADAVNNFYECRVLISLTNKYAGNTVEKKFEGCYQSDTIVIKSIRLHSNNMVPWFLKTNIKMVQLIRDPRAIFHSQFKARKMFSEWTYHIDDLCQKMISDAKMEDLLPPNRFAQLRYEELINDPLPTLVKLYKKLEIPFDKYVARAILKHLDDVPANISANSYTSTYRGTKHEMDAWKTNMAMEDLTKIEHDCAQTFDFFGYQPFIARRQELP